MSTAQTAPARVGDAAAAGEGATTVGSTPSAALLVRGSCGMAE